MAARPSAVRRAGRARRAGLAPLTPRTPLLVARGVLLPMAMAVAAAALLLLGRADEPTSLALADGLAGAVYVVAALLVLLRGVLVWVDRAAWLTLGVGLAGYAAGKLVGAAEPGTNSVPALAAGIGELVIYPAAYVTGALLLRTQVRFLSSLWLDGLIGGLGAAALTASMFAYGPLAPGLDVTGFELARLAADLLLLALLAGILPFFTWRPPATWWLFGAGLVLFAIADYAAVFSSGQLPYAGAAGVSRSALAVLWPTAVLLLAVAAWQPVREVPPLRLAGWSVISVPVLFALASLGLLLWAAITPLPLLVPALATATLLVALGRAVLTIAEVQALSDARRQAVTDDLTGLPNRRHVYERLRQLVAHQGGDAAQQDGASSAQPFGVLIVDLDRFKEVNDSYGHRAGDEMLRLVGPRLSRALPADASLARLGGDEFAVIVHRRSAVGSDVADGHQRDDEVTAVAGRMLAELQAPLTVIDPTTQVELELHLDASVGIALFPEHAALSAQVPGQRAGQIPAQRAGQVARPADTVDMLLQRADIAMYQAKRARRGVETYRGNWDQEIRWRLETVEALRAALADPGQLLVHYQPQVCLRSGHVAGLEALVRWQHPEHGLLVPETFLPLAEQNGMMARLTQLVLERALEDYATIRGAVQAEAGPRPPPTLSVNVSVSDLQDGALPERLRGLLQRHQVPPAAVTLEITEDVLMRHRDRAHRTLTTLRQLGVGVAIDDYGKGYSSLSYLCRLPVDQLKLDHSFVQDLRSSQAGNSAPEDRSSAIVRSTLQLAHALGIPMVAEGVEDEQTARLLARWGCDLAQGHFFSRALPAAQVLAALRSDAEHQGAGGAADELTRYRRTGEALDRPVPSERAAV